jgi:hypothetical protein
MKSHYSILGQPIPQAQHMWITSNCPQPGKLQCTRAPRLQQSLHFHRGTSALVTKLRKLRQQINPSSRISFASRPFSPTSKRLNCSEDLV